MRAPGAISRRRLAIVDALIIVASLLGVVAMLAVWANRLLFSPDNWSSTSTELLARPSIREATANYVVDQLYANVNVAGLLQAGLPPRLEPLAGPAAGALRGVAVQGVELALTRPRVQSLWATANRAADHSFIALVNGGKGPVGTQSGVVTLDIGSIVGDVAARLGLPAGLSSKLPPNIGKLTVMKAKQIKFVQDAGNAVRSLALWLTILVPVLYGVAIIVARGHRRRTLMSAGLAIVLVGLIGVAGRRILIGQVADSLVSDVSLRPAIRDVVTIATSILRDIAAGFLVVGAVTIASAWFAGPARVAVAGRRRLAPFLREQPGWTFAIVGSVMVLVFIWQPIHAAGTPAGIITFTLLALLGTETLRRQTAREFPTVPAREETIAAEEGAPEPGVLVHR